MFSSCAYVQVYHLVIRSVCVFVVCAPDALHRAGGECAVGSGLHHLPSTMLTAVVSRSIAAGGLFLECERSVFVRPEVRRCLTGQVFADPSDDCPKVVPVVQ